MIKYITRTHEENSAELYRSEYARDRDRVLYSKEFRRLSGKTQVFVAGFDDHTRTRLTHTLEVNQIAKTIGTALLLDLELIEAIALAHDVGHTPFGHIGERFLNLFNNGCLEYSQIDYKNFETLKGFKHNLQGVRVADTLEKINNNFPGINLTHETLWGIMYHSKVANHIDCEYARCEKKIFYCHLNGKRKECHNEGKLSFQFYSNYINDLNKWTIEGMVVGIADEIAQRHHDIEDAIEANIIDKMDLIRKIEEIFELNTDQVKIVEEIKHENIKELILYRLSKLIVSMYVDKYIAQFKAKFSGLDHGGNHI